MVAAVDQISLQFNPASLQVLNVVLGLVMFGVAMDLTLEDFRRVARKPRAAVIGLFAQFILLPTLTFGLVSLINPQPSIALGMMLVASCPGGNISNFLTHYAKGNTALSVSMSAISTLGAIVMTPFNISFWGGMYEPTSKILKDVAIDPISMGMAVLAMLGVPLVLGMTLRARKPQLADRFQKPMKIFSLIVFGGFIAGALAANWQNFLTHIGAIALVVFLHNAVAISGGYFAARLGGLPERDRRAVSIEVGIQNSGLGLVLIFNFFDGMGGMALIAAWWGVWHIFAGLTVANIYLRRPLGSEASTAIS